MSPSRQTVLVFPCHGDELVGILHRPEGARAHPLGVLIVVGGPQYRVGSHRQFVLMARRFAGAGYPVFRFDYRGMGDASGGARTFEDADEDISAAMNAFRAQFPAMAGVVILGLCDAASAALIYCRRESDVAGLVLLNPWVRTEEGAARAIVRHYYLRRLLQRSLWRKLLGGDFRIFASLRGVGKSMRRAWASHAVGSGRQLGSFLQRMAQGAAEFDGPVLLLLSGRDLTAKEFEDFCTRNAHWANWLSAQRVTQVKLHDADHTFSTTGALAASCEHITKWLGAIAAKRGSIVS